MMATYLGGGWGGGEGLRWWVKGGKGVLGDGQGRHLPALTDACIYLYIYVPPHPYHPRQRRTYPRGSTASLRLVIWSFSITSMSFSTRSICVTTPIVRFDSGSTWAGVFGWVWGGEFVAVGVFLFEMPGVLLLDLYRWWWWSWWWSWWVFVRNAGCFVVGFVSVVVVVVVVVVVRVCSKGIFVLDLCLWWWVSLFDSK